MFRQRAMKYTVILFSLFAAVVLLSLLSLSLGGVKVPVHEIWLSLTGRNTESSNLIVMQFRLPRILAAVLIGAALAVAGAILQGVIRNPLASPDLLGVTGGASVAVVAFMTLMTGYSIHWVPFIAIAGALAAVVLNYVFTWKRGVSPFRLVLIGIGISTAMGALTTFLLISGPAYLAAQVLNWMTGSIYGTNWSYIKVLWPWVALFIPLALLYAKELNVQSLGARDGPRTGEPHSA
ncbi:FecCD family ABC transporter permease [Paenibacillus gorillae]|uniref:FecCD family ABC transporter permease n=1 Tax=Paenibacillus gorillae TaxID=1243662 RepID=UPI001EE1FBB0|nr:iron ABC transporter permease [Paenibacillus gorillae]